jgi:hypothetical protein
MLVEIKWINVRRNTTVFSNRWWKQLHVSALFWLGHLQIETRISEKTHVLQCGHQAWGTRSRFTMFGEECSYILYTRCGICEVYDFICRVFCKMSDTWAGVVFERCFWKRWLVCSWLGRLHKWLLWRRQSGLWSNCLREGLDNWIFVWRCVCYVCEGYYLPLHVYLWNS